MVRRKNVLATLMHSFILAALISVQWALYGYSLAFSTWHALIGGLQWAGLYGVSATDAYAGYSSTIPHQAYMVFQCMFAVVTPALITGAFAERISFEGFLVFSILWATLIYDPLAHWVWGVDGWLLQLGALDFAMLGAASGAVAGLVAITPASGFVAPMPAIIIGLGAGVLFYGAVRLKRNFGYDDALDVVGVHGVGGTWGALATGPFASVAVNAAGANGWFYGNPRQLLTQAIAVASSISFAFFGSFVLLKITDSIAGLRVDDDAERLGLDLSQNDENAYALGA